MTVNELIEKLKEFPGDMNVTRRSDWCPEIGQYGSEDVDCVTIEYDEVHLV